MQSHGQAGAGIRLDIDAEGTRNTNSLRGGPRRLPEIAGQVEGVAIRTEAQFFDAPTVEGEADIDVGATVVLYRRVISGAEPAPPELAAWTDLIERIFPISPAV